MKLDFRTRRMIGLTCVAPMAGFLLIFILEKALGIDVPRLAASLFNLALVTCIVLFVVPRDLLRRSVLPLPGKVWRHVLLGLFLAGCTLSGMLAASWSTGKYVLDLGRVSLTHSVFSLNPALLEELFYRGILMLLLLRVTRSVKTAGLIQVLLFGVFHIKGFGGWALVDAFSVALLAAGFTFVAWQTRSLVAGVVFHYFHDALLFLVQVPAGTPSSNQDRVVFYAGLWLMIGIGCAATRLAATRCGVCAKEELYSPTLG